MLPACDIHSISANGDLDGMWCLTQVDTLATGTAIPYRDQRVFWSFASDIMSVRQMPVTSHGEFICHFQADGGTLLMSDLYVSDRVNGDSLVSADSLHIVHPLGINRLHEQFAIHELSGNRLTLKGSILKLYFEKY